MDPEDALNAVFELARGDALKKIWLDEAINQTVNFTSNSTNATAPPVYEVQSEPEMLHTFRMDKFKRQFTEAGSKWGAAVSDVSMGVLGIFKWGVSGNAEMEDVITNPLQT